MRGLGEPTTWAIIAAFVPAVLFPLFYAFRPWFRYPVGRSLMALSLVIAATLAMSLYFRLTGDFPPEWVRVAVFTGVAIVLWSQFFVLVTTHKKPLNGDNHPHRRKTDRKDPQT